MKMLGDLLLTQNNSHSHQLRFSFFSWGGTVSYAPHPHPSQVPPAAQVGGANHQHREAGQTTRGSMALAASQSYGRTEVDNWRYWGGAANKRQTDGEDARGVERDARAGKLPGGAELGMDESRRGERGGDQSH